MCRACDLRRAKRERKHKHKNKHKDKDKDKRDDDDSQRNKKRKHSEQQQEPPFRDARNDQWSAAPSIVVQQAARPPTRPRTPLSMDFERFVEPASAPEHKESLLPRRDQLVTPTLYESKRAQVLQRQPQPQPRRPMQVMVAPRPKPTMQVLQQQVAHSAQHMQQLEQAQQAQRMRQSQQQQSQQAQWMRQLQQQQHTRQVESPQQPVQQVVQLQQQPVRTPYRPDQGDFKRSVTKTSAPAPAPAPASRMTTGEHLVTCPHCGGTIMVAHNQIACSIFRHGVYNEHARGSVVRPVVDDGSRQAARLPSLVGQLLPPHSSRALCDHVVAYGLIHGCGKPFRFNGREATKCDYI